MKTISKNIYIHVFSFFTLSISLPSLSSTVSPPSLPLSPSLSLPFSLSLSLSLPFSLLSFYPLSPSLSLPSLSPSLFLSLLSLLSDCLQPEIIKPLLTHDSHLISCGESHVAVLTLDHKIFTWGSGKYGCLGNGSEDNW